MLCFPAKVTSINSFPVTVRKEPRPSPCKPQRWKGFTRSSIRTHSRCKLLNTSADPPTDDDEESPPSPTASQSTRGGKVTASTGSGRKRQRGGRGGRQCQGQKHKTQDRPFCTQNCLWGFAYWGPIDENCPNFDDHGPQHMDGPEFLRLVRVQLAEDRGPDADAVPLYLSGSRGSLFKVRLSSHGYTLVAKSIESLDLGDRRHENELYGRLRAIQGKHVPICLGIIDLIQPYYYDSCAFKHFLFLSWAGRPLFECANHISKIDIVNAVTTAFEELHRLHVLHQDAEPRNLLYYTHTCCLMIVDFERAEFRERQPLGAISSNSRRKRKRGHKRGRDDFARELQHVVGHVTR